MTTQMAVLNAFSVDVEGFVEANAEAFPATARPQAQTDLNVADEIRRNTHAILDLMDETEVKGTFFILGRIALDMPTLVADVASRGHEVGCHSHEHLRLFGMPPERVRHAVIQAKSCLEDAAGAAVIGFRAPDFSITADSLWVLDILREAGFLYDSSVVPTGVHDVYGVASALPTIHRLENGLVEFPPTTFKIGYTRVPFGGGGYFRLYPYRVTQALLSRANRRGEPIMHYIHPYEVGPLIPRVDGLPRSRRFRHYHRCGSLHGRTRRMLRDFRFAPVSEVLREHGMFDGEAGDVR
jgi:polysaccharide deacetylase family protein (PEP-CTERM system associated)